MITEAKAYLTSIDPKAKSIVLTTCQNPTQNAYQALRISAETLHLIEIENAKTADEWHLHISSKTATHNHKPASEVEKSVMVKKMSTLLHAVSAHRVSVFVEKESQF